MACITTGIIMQYEYINFHEYTFSASTGEAYFDKFPTDNLILSLPWDTTLFIKVIWFNHTQSQPLDYACNLCSLALESNAQLSTDLVTITHCAAYTIHFGLLYYVCGYIISMG